MIVRTKKKPSYKLISTYKTELMGVAAISVLIGHAGTAIIADTGAILLVPKMATLICTLMYMFFFLSGFGCFYSLNKSNDIHKFYNNRIKKVLLQLLLRLGTFQLSDIFYNTVGGVLGGLMCCVVMKARKRL